MSGSGGVSVRAGPSPKLRSRRVRARPALRRVQARLAAQGDGEARALTGALLCAECGRLEWPERADAMPHRTEGALVPMRTEACPHCGDNGWIDLRVQSTALAIRQGEELVAAELSLPKEIAKSAGLGLVFGGFILMTGGLVSSVAVAVLSMIGAGAYTYRQHRKSAPPARTLPDRWSMALPPSMPTLRTVTGEAVAAETMRAPLTGRPCIAYEVGLRDDEDASGPLPSWALLEQRVAAIDVDGHAVEPSRTFVELPRERLGPFSAETLDEAGLAWLRDRGFSCEGTTLVVYESILAPETRVSVEIARDQAVLRSR